MTCGHKTVSSHSRLNAFGARVWTCSDCKREGLWTPKWAYHGSLECRACERAAIDHVSCGCKPQTGRPSAPRGRRDGDS